ncbi:MAG: oligopeptide transporter, OPT family [Termitinemataceae bacterium]|nr:MAG: oligopeptide transporter, OPT family [Termitinemataceae bacterium]
MKEIFKEQFTFRAVIIGCAGCVVLTMSSLYVALKLGALPWPIVFTALVSMFFLKLLKRGNTGEINVTHTIMSAGAMTAGALAFTIPGIFILNPAAHVNILPLLIVTLGGVVLGLIFTALIREYFIEIKPLPYPMGQAAADTVIAGDAGGRKSKILFSSCGLAGIFTFLRDGLAVFSGKTIFPAALLSSKMSEWGSITGIWLSPMLVSIGYIIGPVFIGIWFLGAILGDFGILVASVKLDFFDGATAQKIKSSLGIGLMIGTGVGIILRGILLQLKRIKLPVFEKTVHTKKIISLRPASLALVLIAVAFVYICDIAVIPSLIIIAGTALTTIIAAQLVGQSGINPMEIFGIVIMLAVKAIYPAGEVAAFFTAAIIAIATGLTGDVMNDFKAGAIMNTSPKAQWLGECVGGLLGAFVALGMFFIVLKAYGASAFGNHEFFPAPQASAVAAMVGGIPHVESFWLGLILGAVLYTAGLPVMTLGLGVYLPFYLSATAFLGVVLRLAAEKIAPNWSKKEDGMIIASGCLGGEAVVGVILALIQAFRGIFA